MVKNLWDYMCVLIIFLSFANILSLVDHNSRTINIKVSTHKSAGDAGESQESMYGSSQRGRRRTGSPPAKSGRKMTQDLKGKFHFFIFSD
jgi:hypothetical protein